MVDKGKRKLLKRRSSATTCWSKSPVGASNHGATTSDDSPGVVIAVKILLVLTILFMLPPLVTSAERQEARRKQKRSELVVERLRYDCQNNKDTTCATMIPEESLNCVNACMSPKCFSTIFANDPLENGEIDFVRGETFEACVKEELRILRRSSVYQR